MCNYFRMYGPQMKKMMTEFIPEGTVEENTEDITVIKVLEKNSNSKEHEVNNFDDEYLFNFDRRPRTKDNFDIPTYKVFFHLYQTNYLFIYNLIYFFIYFNFKYAYIKFILNN